MGRKTILGEGCLKTPRAAFAIPACGVGNPRVRRLEFPRAAFGISACGVWNFRVRRLESLRARTEILPYFKKKSASGIQLNTFLRKFVASILRICVRVKKKYVLLTNKIYRL